MRPRIGTSFKKREDRNMFCSRQEQIFMKKNKFFSRQEHILCGKEQIFAEGKFSSDVATATANRCLYLQKETLRFLEQHPTDVSIRSSDRYCQISNEMGLRLSPGKTVIPWRESQGGADDLFTVRLHNWVWGISGCGGVRHCFPIPAREFIPKHEELTRFHALFSNPKRARPLAAT